MTTGSEVPIEPSGPLTSDEKLWVIFSHVSYFLSVPIILPLIIYLVKKGDSPRVAYHAREALNFHISLLIYAVICGLLVVTLFLLPVLGIFGAIFAIVATIKSAGGTAYRYPLTLRLVK